MKKWMYNALLIFFAAVFLGSAGYLAFYLISSRQEANNYANLQEIVQNDTTPRPTINDDDTLTPVDIPPKFAEVTDPETGETVRLLSKFAELYVMNNDIVGWLEIPGSEISYPVMQTPDQVDYYLKHNFNKESSNHGCLYVREVCNVTAPSDNLTIYGHRMRDRSMFAQLDKYMEKSYWEENPYIYFDTLTELHTYKVMAVFLTTATVDKGFAYHEFVDAADETEFNEFVKTCKDLALYGTGVDAEYCDKFITLSTCEYSQTNGRLVVVAKRLG